MTGLVVCAAVLAAATVFGVWHRRADGRLKKVDGSGGERLLGAAELGRALGERATLVQFSSAYCQQCRATRRVLAELAGTSEGVARVELDVEDRLELVRELNILRTPTVLVLDRAGRIVGRAAGRPDRAALLATLDERLP
ncbi:thioredoxin family protein [Streptomyces sp. NBRC 109706]|uniref:thioredoxin family protein n=1 Tax=Streptomyces sp. NBRC 109706 TaxID=1550035 RepID=UPI000781D34D|nr:thioredoxin family protein [Streptomyces sp. NBRC 109706]